MKEMARLQALDRGIARERTRHTNSLYSGTNFAGAPGGRSTTPFSLEPLRHACVLPIDRLQLPASGSSPFLLCRPCRNEANPAFVSAWHFRHFFRQHDRISGHRTCVSWMPSLTSSRHISDHVRSSVSKTRQKPFCQLSNRRWDRSFLLFEQLLKRLRHHTFYVSGLASNLLPTRLPEHRLRKQERNLLLRIDGNLTKGCIKEFL